MSLRDKTDGYQKAPGSATDKYIKIQKLQPSAVLPERNDQTEVSYNVTLTGRTEDRTEDDVSEDCSFNTGIEITPPTDHYISVVPNNDLHKCGYMFMGPYIAPRGTELIVVLFKFREDDDLDLPFQAVQIVLCPYVNSHMSAQQSSRKQRSSIYENVDDDDDEDEDYGSRRRKSRGSKHKKGMPRPQVHSKKSNFF